MFNHQHFRALAFGAVLTVSMAGLARPALAQQDERERMQKSLEVVTTLVKTPDVTIPDYILDRARATGEAYLPEQVHAVVDTQLAYLREIGAIGPPAESLPGELPSEPPDDRPRAS